MNTRFGAIAIVTAVILLGIPDAVNAGVGLCFGDPASEPTLVGTSGKDRLIGTRGPDVIIAKGGQDFIRGRGGDDKICGGDGTDTIYGSAGFDLLDGGTGSDASINGGRGDDTMRGLAGQDHLIGEMGDDSLIGGLGDDLLSGGEGFDYIRYHAAPAPGVVINLKENRVTGSHGTDTVVTFDGLADVEGAYGSEFSDRIGGNRAKNTFVAKGGNDRVIGTLGADLISGGAGSDLISFAALRVAGGVTIDLESNLGSVGRSFRQTFAFIEHVIGSKRNDDLRGDPEMNRIVGGGGDDRLQGRNGDDDLLGGPGSDRLLGGRGRDLCRKGPGKDLARSCER